MTEAGGRGRQKPKGMKATAHVQTVHVSPSEQNFLKNSSALEKKPKRYINPAIMIGNSFHYWGNLNDIISGYFQFLCRADLNSVTHKPTALSSRRVPRRTRLHLVDAPVSITRLVSICFVFFPFFFSSTFSNMCLNADGQSEFIYFRSNPDRKRRTEQPYNDLVSFSRGKTCLQRINENAQQLSYLSVSRKPFFTRSAAASMALVIRPVAYFLIISAPARCPRFRSITFFPFGRLFLFLDIVQSNDTRSCIFRTFQNKKTCCQTTYISCVVLLPHSSYSFRVSPTFCPPCPCTYCSLCR